MACAMESPIAGRRALTMKELRAEIATAQPRDGLTVAASWPH